MKYYLIALKKYAVFKGRASRREFWMFYLFNVIFMLLAVVLDFMLGTTIQSNGVSLSLFSTGYSLALLIPMISIGVRRLHDVGKNGWIIVILYILFVPYYILRVLAGRWMVLDIIAFILNIYIIASGIYIFVLLLLPGNIEDNKYGPSPSKVQQLILEDKKIENTEPQQFKKQKNFEKVIIRRTGIFLVVIILMLLILAGTFFYASWSLNFVKVKMDIYQGINLNGSIINKSAMEFKYVKIEFVLDNNDTIRTKIGNLQPHQEQLFNLSLSSKHNIDKVIITGWNVIAIISLILSVLSITIMSVLGYFWHRDSSKYSLQVIDASVYTINLNKGVKGVLVNNRNREFSNIKIRFAVYDSGNNQIGTADIIVDNIQPYKRAVFQESLDQKLSEMGASSVELIKITKA